MSLNRAKPKPTILKPRAGAIDRRPVPRNEFRLFYDRGDLPVGVEHGP